MSEDHFTPFVAGVLACLLGFIAVRSGDAVSFLFFGSFAVAAGYAAVRSSRL